MSSRSLAARQNPFARLVSWNNALQLLPPFLLALAAWQWGHLAWSLAFAYGRCAQRHLPPHPRRRRSALAMVNPLLVLAIVVAGQKDAVLTRAAAYAAMIGTALALLLTLWPEAQRLTPTAAAYRRSPSWRWRAAPTRRPCSSAR